ncbi:MAG: ribonuclease HII [Gammaproteobacteria bacterium]|jgi:ribonuclease HII|nr:ribonuclease HII [Gammaproteobacteria bacterium]MBT7604006.1 ribonuclease HII [Gammaproteobacteria bacterium]
MKKKYTIVGIDEAGRGPLAGPVVAASVVVDEKYLPKEIDDSKKVSEKNRNAFYEVIIKNAAEYGIGIVDSEEIDKINIHNATLEAMKRAYNNIKKDEYKVYIDGIFTPDISGELFAIKHGDRIVPIISAASILAKVTRDRIMIQIDKEFPVYNFKKHKGYPTKYHIEMIKKYGICKYHRKSYKPISML